MKKIMLLALLAFQVLSCKKDNDPVETPHADATDYHQTATTQFVTAGETKFAYRILGKTAGIPLLMISSLGSSMDDWDPAITNGLAQGNKVILFDIEGVGTSSGRTPDNIPDMAKGVVAFIKALGYDKVNLMGFSMGAFISQQIVLTEPNLINKLILTGTGPKGSEGLSKLPELLAGTANLSPEESFLHVGFTASDASQREGKRAYARIQERMINRDLPLSTESTTAELTAVLDWAKPYPEALKELAAVTQSVLIAQGQEDVPVPVTNAIKMSESMPNAQLIVYKDAGHAAVFQYPTDFVQRAVEFLKRVN